jgi:ABC-type multidrug transport system fused ATPase/permease subunit
MLATDEDSAAEAADESVELVMPMPPTTPSPTSRLLVKEPHGSRRSHFEALLEKTRSQPYMVVAQHSIDEDNEEDDEDDKEQDGEQSSEGKNGFTQVSSLRQLQIPSSPTSPSTERPGMMGQRRESCFVDIGDGYNKFQAHLGMDRHVQVNLRNFSYHVPVKMDSPSIKTVLNQSPSYAIFEFFRRVHHYCQRKTSSPERWAADTTSDLFLPFDKKAILSQVTLCFQPGKTYLILAPPGGGKTTLLKAIAGRLHYGRDLSGHPIKNYPHIDGRIEFNGVTKEVS